MRSASVDGAHGIRQVIFAEYVRFETGRLWKSRQDSVTSAEDAAGTARFMPDERRFSEVL